MTLRNEERGTLKDLQKGENQGVLPGSFWSRSREWGKSTTGSLLHSWECNLGSGLEGEDEKWNMKLAFLLWWPAFFSGRLGWGVSRHWGQRRTGITAWCERKISREDLCNPVETETENVAAGGLMLRWRWKWGIGFGGWEGEMKSCS